MTLFAKPTEMTMTTIQLVSVACRDHSAWQAEPPTERKPKLNMSWVVVTDENGKWHLRMRWVAAKS
jgi:hypothetical protein